MLAERPRRGEEVEGGGLGLIGGALLGALYLLKYESGMGPLGTPVSMDGVLYATVW
jgi:ABC-type xylose transport system permease subunit